MNIYNYVSDLQLSVGESKRFNCPNCNGFKTFTATNNMGMLLWNCYKVSCNISGSTRIHLSVDDIRDAIDPSVIDDDMNDFVLPEHVVAHRDRLNVLAFCNRWSIDTTKVDVLYDVKEDRIVFPILSDTKMVDATGRSLGARLPKWKRYGRNSLPFTHGCGSVAVVVEDCVSAIAVGNEVYVGVALLGTSLAEAHKRYLSQFSTAIIALDPDALPKTLSFAKELRGHVHDVKVLRLQDDFKYRNKIDYEELTKLTPKE
tara:strand:+ start:501 stop:1274 length:774 start_codon:yes stop_codon:yes gene_type:complete